MLRRVVFMAINSSTSSANRKGLSTTAKIPEEFGNQLATLFKQSKYEQLIQVITSSQYKNTIPMMRLLAEAHQLLKLEHEDEYDRTIAQIKYIEKHGFPS